MDHANHALCALRLVICGSEAGATNLLAALSAGPKRGRRKLIVADTPAGDTRSLVTEIGAADAALIVVDAVQGLSEQARQHGVLLSLFGLRRVALVVDKLDLVGDKEKAFLDIANDYLRFAEALGFDSITPIPLSAPRADNATSASLAIPWHGASTLTDWLESLDLHSSREVGRFRFSGDVISSADAPAQVADQFEAALVWMHDEPLLPGRPYLVKVGAQQVTGTVTEIKHKVNVNTMERLAAKKLESNDIAVCNISLAQRVAFDPGTENRNTGSVYFTDGASGATLGVGMLHFALRRAHNIHAQRLDVRKAERAALKGQRPCVLWFTGLSGAGKTTIANLVEKKLHAMGKHTYLLDGDNVRLGLNKDLGFTDVDRVENIRRVAEVSKLMVDAGLIVITAFISPYRADRDMSRSLLEPEEFIEIHVDTPLEVAEARDPKGLYKKARRGELVNFTGIDSPYEAPQSPELRLPGASPRADTLADQVIELMQRRGLLST